MLKKEIDLISVQSTSNTCIDKKKRKGSVCLPFSFLHYVTKDVAKDVTKQLVAQYAIERTDGDGNISQRVIVV